MRIGKKITHLYNRVDYSVGKKLFGNTVGIQNNLSGSLKKITTSKKEYDDSRINELKENEFLMLKHPFEESLINSISLKYEKMIEDEKNSIAMGKHDGKVYSRHIKDPEKHIPEIENLITDDIRHILEGYYDGYFDIRMVIMNRNYHIPKEIENMELFSNNWHCDNRSTEFLKLFVCLNDVTEENGPFCVVTPKRSKELMRGGFGTREEYKIPVEIIEDPKFLKKAIAERGSAYFGNPQVCLHRASNPGPDKHRDIIHIIFGKASKPLPKNWLDSFVQGKNYNP